MPLWIKELKYQTIQLSLFDMSQIMFDHNIRTLDGNDTFHGMGIIASVTPGTKHSQLVPRRKVNSDDLCTTGRIQIQHQGSPSQAVEIKYHSIVIKEVQDPTANLDIL